MTLVVGDDGDGVDDDGEDEDHDAVDDSHDKGGDVAAADAGGRLWMTMPILGR